MRLYGQNILNHVINIRYDWLNTCTILRVNYDGFCIESLTVCYANLEIFIFFFCQLFTLIRHKLTVSYGKNELLLNFRRDCLLE